MGVRIGIDVGGTFTDFLLMREDASSEAAKVLSSPDDPSLAVLEGLRRLADMESMPLREFLGATDIIVHGTTVTTNAVLTGNIARTALLTTSGFRDALQMRRGMRERLYDNKFAAPAPLIPRTLRVGIRERTSHTGEELAPLDVEAVRAAVDEFKAQGIEAVAISFMHSYADPLHEEEAARIVSEGLGSAYLSVSSRVLPQVRFYDRTSTTVLNAVVGPILRRYFDALTRMLDDQGFRGTLLIMQSNGGVGSSQATVERAASTLLSGPAAAPIAGLAYARLHDCDSFITVDMGGTSFDAALVYKGEPAVTTHGSVNRFAMALPSMDIVTIGAGGGSIGWIDEGLLLKMGPRSAGAKPGPACYGLGGTEPTCSDANLVLGYLSESYFAGGAMRLDAEAGRRAIQQTIAAPLGLDAVQAAAGMHHVMNVNMASAIREISVQRGHDPRAFLLISGGGAAGIHIARIAEEIGIERILIPREAAIFCAAGMLRSDLKHGFVRSFAGPLSEGRLQSGEFRAVLDHLRGAGRAVLNDETIAPDRQRFDHALDLRYGGQYHEVTVSVPAAMLDSGDVPAIAELFHGEHDRRFGYSLREEGSPIELINVRLTATGVTLKPEIRASTAPLPGTAARKGRRAAYDLKARRFDEIEVFNGDQLSLGHVVDGPALIESVNTTLLVTAGWKATVDPYRATLMTRH